MVRGATHAFRPRRRDNTFTLNAAERLLLFRRLEFILSDIASKRSWGAWLATTCEWFDELGVLLFAFEKDRSTTYDERLRFMEWLARVLAAGMHLLCSRASARNGGSAGGVGGPRLLLESRSRACTPAADCITMLADWYQDFTEDLNRKSEARFSAAMASPSILTLTGVLQLLPLPI